MLRTGWVRVVAVSLLVAWLSLASNITTQAQLSGEANTLLAGRLVVSKLLNSGTIWAGLPILAGWLVRRPWWAVLAGGVSAELALVAHYAAGQLLGIFQPGIWRDNGYWFVFGLFCALLGPIGALARRADWIGLLARLAIPAGALAEPFVVSMFSRPQILPWPDRFASTACGVLLLAMGLWGTFFVVRDAATAHREPVVSE
ncbi:MULTISPECIES: hypothetical protein [unclassified Luteococcus]|uniref:hypothetical protein n=1 Tax=unclassified Luteococcus TaxID=2639923 RepID=UPI00313EA91B